MTTTAAKIRFFEGGNLAALIAVPSLFAASLYFYDHLVKLVQPWGIDVADVYGYVFNLYAIEVGALIAIFALFACRPTPFLERMKNTNTFAAIVANTHVTLSLIVLTLGVTFALGIFKMHPRDTLEAHSVAFLAWCFLTVATTAFCVRTVRLLLTALG